MARADPATLHGGSAELGAAVAALVKSPPAGVAEWAKADGYPQPPNPLDPSHVWFKAVHLGPIPLPQPAKGTAHPTAVRAGGGGRALVLGARGL